MNEPLVTVERLHEYSNEAATGIGWLMPFLSEQLTDVPINERLLQDIVASPYHEQLVARLDGIIVGAVTLNLLMGPAAGREGYLEDFVTDPAVRGRGIGDRIWQEMIAWCRERNINLSFTSHPRRDAAQRFYRKHGAETRDTTVFYVPITEHKT